MVGTIGWLRTSGVSFVDSEVEFSDEQRDYFEIIRKSLIREYCNMHDETMKNEFSVKYSRACVFRSEKFKYYKEFQLQRRIEYGQIVKKYRNQSEWETITDRSKEELNVHLDNKANDTMAFRISFYLMLEHLMRSKCGVPFSDYSILSQNIIRFSDDAFKRVIELSEDVPIYIISLNDACVLWREKLYIFGCESMCYIQAFYHWLVIIQNLCDGLILGKYPIKPLIKCFVDHTPLSSSSTESTTVTRKSLYDLLCGSAREAPPDPHRKLIEELRQPSGGGLKTYLTEINTTGAGFDMVADCRWATVIPRSSE